MQKTDCQICDSLPTINSDIHFVKELETGYVLLRDNNHLDGYVLFICRTHHEELHELPEKFKHLYLTEMSYVAAAVFKAFNPAKLNYALLGNKIAHLHWHIIPRYINDPFKLQPIWEFPDKYIINKDIKPDIEKLSSQKTKLLTYL